MKLRAIRENFLSQKMREALVAASPRALPLAGDASPPYEPTSGHGANEIANKCVRGPIGFPASMRHRKFFGLKNVGCALT